MNPNVEVDVCVLLATYRRPQLLDQTLRSLAAQSLDGLSLETIVVDNAGEEATRAVVERHAAAGLRVRYLVQVEKRGKSAAVNLGLEQVPRCTLLVLTDDDIIAKPDWIAQLVGATKRWPDASLFGGRIVPHFPSDTRGIDISSPWVRIALAVENDNGDERIVPSGKLWGANLAVRGSLLTSEVRFNENLGPADGNYITGCESDFTHRLESKGAKAVFAPLAIVQHVIRDEQLSATWLCKRAYKQGKGDAIRSPRGNKHLWFGVPRWLYRRRAEWTLKRWIYTLLGQASKSLDARMELEFLRGCSDEYAQQGQRT